MFFILRKKVLYLKRVAEILRDQYDGDIPQDLAGLCMLPGVGPKMAHLCMDIAWGSLTGIGKSHLFFTFF